jgi:hypothetical protein
MDHNIQRSTFISLETIQQNYADWGSLYLELREAVEKVCGVEPKKSL